MVKVKICGITNLEDALQAVEAGADALGFNFYSKSPRCLTSKQAKEIMSQLPPFVTCVGVFVNAKREDVQKIVEETGIEIVQFHGDERPQDCEPFSRAMKAFRVEDKIGDVKLYDGISAILLDASHQGDYGGTGKTFDWKKAEPFQKLGKPLILSGGLGPDNVMEAVQKVRPYAVDACSRLEDSPGKKNHEYIRLFIRRAKEAIE
ncbi:MAG: phosphoribosylanthranilate isomerase [Chlamydiae bacterium]|nr:phosphoribosylanthranilate isomerase [Chlamydiota bacterium]MBI3266005.1 phosphoribosylanthranilate isomerase [Chlamydiota bacterium]